MTSVSKPVVSSTLGKGIGCKAVAAKTNSGNKAVTAVKTGTTISTASAAKHSSLLPKANSAVHSNKSSLVSKPTSSFTKATTSKTATASKEVISNVPSKNDEEETLQVSLLFA